MEAHPGTREVLDGPLDLEFSAYTGTPGDQEPPQWPPWAMETALSLWQRVPAGVLPKFLFYC